VRWSKVSATDRRQQDEVPEREFAFIMTYGRSGSTLLQAVLNSAPGVLIRGENRAMTYHLYQYHTTAVKEAERVKQVARRPFNPWFGMYDYPAEVSLERIRQLVVDTLLRPEPDTRLLGFKEVRWYYDDLKEYVDFLRAVFPGCRFIVNTRRLQDVAKSGWWRDRPDPLGELQEIEARILTVAERLGDSAYAVSYDDYATTPERLRGLYEWLGLPFDPERVRQVIGARTYAPLSVGPAAEPRIEQPRRSRN
jgi:hypothetical protein